MLTKQEIFDKALNGLRSQNYAKSTKSPNSGSCAYRGHNGLKCAIGHCVDDDTLAAAMDDGLDTWQGASMAGATNIGDLISSSDFTFSMHHELVALFDPADRSFLTHLQSAHDSMNGPEAIRQDQFESAMESIAIRYNLIYKEPQ